MPQWVDEDGKRVSLGERVGPRGGEGEIFRVQGEPAFVAKIYHQPGDASKAEKLRRLRQLANPALAKVAAWPARCLFVADGSGRLAGFIMPLGQGRRVERLYNPRDRRQDFPRAGWDFLLHVARNCAAAFETLHEHKVIMADVNEGNVLVTDDGLVRLIDCDSYQVDRPNGVAMTCDVGVPLWTPPELQGRSLQGVVRTVDHDRFGLAVLIFHLLFMGRHPYAGVPLSKQPEDLPIDAAIKRGQFAFGASHPALVLRPPPHTLNL
ncbi:MAG: protein kinase, partial [Rhodospirillales bacterium]|nr:protein kinase [Acetobacter sp.]